MPDSVPSPGSKSFRLMAGGHGIPIATRLRCAFPAGLALLCIALLGIARTTAQAPATPVQRFVVVLDAAHGGVESGGQLGTSTGQFQLEKAYTLALSVRLRSLLAARGIAVVTTRESDAVVDADHRAEVANRANAQACITLHASQSGTGVHIYASSLAPAEQAAMLPWKTAQAAWVTRSLALAGVLNSSLAHAGLNVALGRTDLPTINSMSCPALALEIGKSSSPQAAENGGFDDAEYQARIAQALAAGILEWKANGWRTSSVSSEAARQ
jgi:N-acetylmuramoyl-L-alanine amidase